MDERYTRMIDRHIARENYLENIFNNNAIAMEDSTLATPSNSNNSNDSQSSSSNSNEKKESFAVSELKKSYHAYEKKYENAEDGKTSSDKKEDEEGKDTNDDKKDKKEKSELKEIIEKVKAAISEFMKNQLTHFRVSASRMLDENRDFEAVLADYKAHLSEPDETLVIRNFPYDDSFFIKFGDAITNGFTEYRQHIESIKSDIDSMNMQGDNEASAKEKAEEIKRKIESLKASAKESEGDDDSKKIKPTEEDAIAPNANPIYVIANKLGIVNEVKGELTKSQLMSLIREKFRGSKEPEEFAIKEKPNTIAQAERFLRNYRNELKRINANIDQMKTAANTYKGICDKINQQVDHIDPKLHVVYRNTLNILSKNINEFMTINEFRLSLFQERATNCDLLLKKAYHVNDAKKRK